MTASHHPATAAELLALAAYVETSGRVIISTTLEDRQLIAAALRHMAVGAEAVPVAWMHTLHVESFNEPDVRVTMSPTHPFGVSGEDFDPSFWTSTEPLYPHPVGTPPAAPEHRREGELAGLERAARWHDDEADKADIDFRMGLSKGRSDAALVSLSHRVTCHRADATSIRALKGSPDA